MSGCTRQQPGSGALASPSAEFRKLRDHALSFGAVNGGLLVLNLLTSPHHLWFFWPLFGWGLGLAAHTLSFLPHLNAWRQERRAAFPPPPFPPLPATDADQHRPWPDLEER